MGRLSKLVSLFLALSSYASATVYLDESFDDETWKDRWVQSSFKEDYGKAEISSGKYPLGDETYARGLKLTQDARHYAIAAPFKKDFANKGKTFVVQYSVKHEQNLDCGGGYLKLFPAKTNLKTLHGGENETPYNIMFGPDWCGGTRKTHVIFNYNGTNHLVKREIPPMTDEISHLYTLIVKPDRTYRVLIDNEEKAKGDLTDDFDFLAPKKIKDPEAKKPEDWDEREFIPDPEDTKPADWDDIPEFIPDPDATKPEDWDDDMDGEWIAPNLKNPDYKGKWEAKKIKNPDFKGIWVHPEIDNPDFKDDPTIGQYTTGVVGIEVWQVRAGSIFDNILVTDDVAVAEKRAKLFLESAAKEKSLKAAADEEAKKKADEAAAEAAKKKADEEVVNKLNEEEKEAEKVDSDDSDSDEDEKDEL